MSDSKDHRLEDIVSSLNSIREQLDETFQAAAPKGLSDINTREEHDKEPGSMALEEYLASRLQQIGEVASEKREIKGLRTGNGWDPSQVVEHVFKIDPISMKRAIEIACSSNRSLKERILNFFRRRREELTIVGQPLVEFIPIWKVKGFHECYYLRTNTYRVNVKDDVVGVEVEGKSRDLILERKQRSFIPAVILQRFQKLGSFLTSESKYFVVGDATELATKKSESELVVTGDGKAMTLDQYTALTSRRSKRIFDLTDLKVRGARIQVREPTMTKETVLDKFREKVIQMPDRFKQILSNRLQISELKRTYVPLIKVTVQKGLVPREIVVNGSSGEIADTELIELME